MSDTKISLQQPAATPAERLLSLLELAEKPSRELDRQIACVIDRKNPDEYRLNAQFAHLLTRYTSSLDAALTLVPDGLFLDLHDWTWTEAPCWCASLQSPVGTRIHVGAKGATAALAVCLAALKANAEALKSAPSLVPTPARGASSPESLPESNSQSETP